MSAEFIMMKSLFVELLSHNSRRAENPNVAVRHLFLSPFTSLCVKYAEYWLAFTQFLLTAPPDDSPQLDSQYLVKGRSVSVTELIIRLIIIF
jgi:hypothetical protein